MYWWLVAWKTFLSSIVAKICLKLIQVFLLDCPVSATCVYSARSIVLVVAMMWPCMQYLNQAAMLMLLPVLEYFKRC